MWWSSRREGNIAGNSKFPPQPGQNQPTHKKATKGAKNKNESQKRIKCRYCLVKVCVNYLEIGMGKRIMCRDHLFRFLGDCNANANANAMQCQWERELYADVAFSDVHRNCNGQEKLLLPVLAIDSNVSAKISGHRKRVYKSLEELDNFLSVSL